MQVIFGIFNGSWKAKHRNYIEINPFVVFRRKWQRVCLSCWKTEKSAKQCWRSYAWLTVFRYIKSEWGRQIPIHSSISQSAHATAFSWPLPTFRKWCIFSIQKTKNSLMKDTKTSCSKTALATWYLIQRSKSDCQAIVSARWSSKQANYLWTSA